MSHILPRASACAHPAPGGWIMAALVARQAEQQMQYRPALLEAMLKVIAGVSYHRELLRLIAVLVSRGRHPQRGGFPQLTSRLDPLGAASGQTRRTSIAPRAHSVASRIPRATSAVPAAASRNRRCVRRMALPTRATTAA